MRSSGCSMPTDNRTRSSGTSSGEPATLAWVIGPGTSISDSTPPSYTACKKSSVRPTRSTGRAADPTRNDTIPP